MDTNRQLGIVINSEIAFVPHKPIVCCYAQINSKAANPIPSLFLLHHLSKDDVKYPWIMHAYYDNFESLIINF